MKKILVTGGARFIGSHLSEALLRQKHEVICLDNSNDYCNNKFKWLNITSMRNNKHYKLVEGDILDLKLLRSLFAKSNIDIVVNLAARAGVRPSFQEPLLYQQVNVEGTTNLLEMSKEFKPEKFIFGSSSSVYGENKKFPFSEDEQVDHPISPYAATKKACELILYVLPSLWNSHHLFTFFYGLRSTTATRYGHTQFTRLICSGKKIPCMAKGIPVGITLIFPTL